MPRKIAIIGAGIVGATIAYSLSKRNVEVHIFDKQAEINDPTLYSLAWLNAFRKVPLDYYLFYNLGLHRWPWFHEEIGGGCDLTWGGALSLAATAAAEETLVKHVKPLYEWGYAVNQLNKEALLQLEPSLQYNNVRLGAYCADEGYVDAAKCTRRLLELAQQRGAKLHRPQVITQLLRKQDRIHALYIDDQVVEFDSVILASGATVSELAATAGISVPQRNTPVFLVQTEPCKQRFHKIAVLHLFLDRLKDIRQNRDGTIWIAEAGDADSVYYNPQNYAQSILDQFSQYFTPARNLAFTHRIVTVPKPADGKSIFGFAPGIDNLYIALSHSAVGIASQIGEWVTRELLDSTPIHWLEQFRLDPKGKVP